MPSPPTIDIDELLAPIPGPSPAGIPVPFAVREKLEEARKEVNPDDFPEDDPRRPDAQKADWKMVSRLRARPSARAPRTCSSRRGSSRP